MLSLLELYSTKRAGNSYLKSDYSVTFLFDLTSSHVQLKCQQSYSLQGQTGLDMLKSTQRLKSACCLHLVHMNDTEAKM